MRYFFHLVGAVSDPDSHGTELKSVAAAQVEAVQFIGQVIRDQPEIVWTGDIRLEVTDEQERVLFAIRVIGTTSPASEIVL